MKRKTQSNICFYLNCVSFCCSGAGPHLPLVRRPGESVTLSWKVQGLSLAYLHWNHQKPGKGLEWIGHIDDGTGTRFAQSLQGQFTITKDTSQNVVYLMVKSLKQDDSAVYYCAKESERHKRQQRCTKTEQPCVRGSEAHPSKQLLVNNNTDGNVFSLF